MFPEVFTHNETMKAAKYVKVDERRVDLTKDMKEFHALHQGLSTTPLVSPNPKLKRNESQIIAN
jgi:hypothetical protein